MVRVVGLWISSAGRRRLMVCEAVLRWDSHKALSDSVLQVNYDIDGLIGAHIQYLPSELLASE